MIWLIIKFSLAIIGLIWASQFLVNSLGRLSHYFKVSFFAAGVVFMAISTTIPELFLGIDSALQGVPSLSLGTVLGSNIADLALVFGVVIIIARSLKPAKIVKSRDATWIFLGTLAPLLLLWDRCLSQIDGLILLFIFLIYLYFIFLSKQQLIAQFKEIDKKRLLIDGIKYVIGIIILLVACKYVVEYGTDLALSFQIPLIVVGVSIYALSTSMPELAFETRAMIKGQRALALGDLAGSLIANSTLVLGITALIEPITVISLSNYLLAGGFLFLLVVFFFLAIKRGWQLNWPIGIILILGYVTFLIVEVV